MIGQENPTVRRYPWVSYGLTVICIVFGSILASLSFDIDNWMSDRQGEGKADEALSYLADRPYLKIPAELLPYCNADCLGQVFRGREAYRTGRAKLPPIDVIDREQRQVHALSAQVRLWMSRQREQRQYGFIPARPNTLAVFTSIFVFPGLLHLMATLFVFFLTGPFLEDCFGRPIFATLYLVCGLTTTMAHFLFFPDSQVPVAGASGAVGGVLGAFLIRLGQSRIVFFPERDFSFFVPSYIVIPVLWLLEQIWYLREAHGRAEIAPVGGQTISFLLGVSVAMVIKYTRFEERVIDPGIEHEISIVQHPALAVALEMRTGGELETARREIAKVLAADPYNVDGWREAYEIAVASHDLADAGRCAARLLELYIRDGEKGLAMELVGDAVDRAGEGLPSRFYLTAASFFEKEDYAGWALDLYMRVGERFPSDPATFRAFFRQGDILKQTGEYKAAYQAFSRARAHPACTAEWQEVVDLALAEVRGLIPEKV